MNTINKVFEDKLYQLPLEDGIDERKNIHAQEGLSFMRLFGYFIQETQEGKI
jgi:hypothetical protein